MFILIILVRIWNIPPALYNIFDTPRLNGYHNESGIAFNVLTKGLRGYSKHPQVLRFKGQEGELVTIHNALAQEMLHRRWHHNSPLWLDIEAKPFSFTPEEFINDLEEIYIRQTSRLIIKE